MSSERHHEGHYGDRYPPDGPRPDRASPPRHDRHYEGHQQPPRAIHRRPREHQQAWQDSRWGREAYTPQEAPHQHPARPEGRGGQEQRHPDQRRDLSGWKKHPEDEEYSRSSSSRYPPLHREWKADQRHRNQGYGGAYYAGPEAVSPRYTQGASRETTDWRPRTWDTTDEMYRRQRVGFDSGYNEGHPGPSREHRHSSYVPSGHYEAREAQQGYNDPHIHPHQEQYEGGGVLQYESQRPASGWEPEIYNMLPSQMDMNKGKRSPVKRNNATYTLWTLEI